jgi:hypothetical protein
MELSKNNNKIVTVLKDKKLNYLVKPFLEMVELDKLKKIKIHKMTWSVIMREFYNEENTKSDIEIFIKSYLVNYGILAIKKKIVDKRVSKERVSKHRADKKALGYKTVSIQLDPYSYERLKQFRKDFDLTYADAISELLSKAPRRYK